MTTLDLIKTLREELEKELQKLRLPAQNESPKIPKVCALTIPENILDPSLYPLVFIEFAGLEDDEEEAMVSLLITIGTYATSDGGGMVDNLNLTEAVREFLLTHKLISCGSLQKPVTAVAIESDAADFYFCQIFCTYKILVVSDQWSVVSGSDSQWSVNTGNLKI